VLSLGAAVLLGALVLPGEIASQLYDATRDPARDLEVLLPQAQRENKRILLVVGGEWCSWCHVLHRFVAENPEIDALWSGRYLTEHVNFSPENENTAFLGRFPRVTDYPHVFVVDATGSLLHSQRMAELEEAHGYSRKRMRKFLEKWAPSAPRH